MIEFFRKLFKQPKKPLESIQTAPLSEEQLEAVTAEVIRFEPPQLIVGTGQSVGKQREHNEDSLFVMNTILSGNGNSIPMGLFIVADGMGGHQNGEVASGVAVRSMASYLTRKLFMPYMSVRQEIQNEPLQEVLQDAVREAQAAVHKLAPGGGTTLTAAFVMGEQTTIAHVGDSRAYFIYPDGRMNAVTRDHSLVRRLQELGQINEKEAAVHPQRNVLYRALGQGEPFDADINTHMLPHPGFLLICSDGLWGVVPEMEIFRIVTNAVTPSHACQELVQAANAAGGPDNITAVLVQYPI